MIFRAFCICEDTKFDNFELLFAPRLPEVRYPAVLRTWKENPHLCPRPYRRQDPSVPSYYYCWLILLAGDVESNPGPGPSTVLSEQGGRRLSDGCAPFRAGSGYLRCKVLNARSIANKTLDLQALLISEDLDVIAITETFLSEDVLDSKLVDVATYTVCRRDRNRHGGGIMLILKSDISVVRREDLETDCELLWTEIIKDSSSIMLGVFYRPPGSGYSPLSELHHSLLSIPDTQHIVLCGDFNLPGRQMDLLSDLLLDRSLTQLVTQPTRGENILDLLLTNSPDMISQVDVVSGIPGSDHDAIQFLARFVKPTLVRQNRPVYNFRKADFDRFRDLLSKIPWNSCFLTDNVDDVWISF